MTEDERGTRTLLVDDWDGTFELTVPSEAKVTFGPSVPGATRQGGNARGGIPFTSAPNRMEYALRVYDGPTEKSGLLAIYTGVHGFRDQTVRFLRTTSHQSGVMISEGMEGPGQGPAEDAYAALAVEARVPHEALRRVAVGGNAVPTPAYQYDRQARTLR